MTTLVVIMKDFLSFSESEKRNLKIGLLVLGGVLLLTNIKPAYYGISQLSIWRTKPRPAERSPNFKAPLYYQGELNDLGTARFVTLDVLVLIFKRIGEVALSQNEVEEIHQGVDLTREFFWRNTNLQLNINFAFLEVEEEMSTELFDEEGKIWPKSGLLEKDLLGRGIEKNQYDCVFLFYPNPKIDVSGSGMKLKRLGKTAYSFASYPNVEVPYPDGSPSTWIFASQFWYSLHTVVYGQDPMEVADWGALASALRHYPIQDPPKPYGRIYLTLDFDFDGVPDDEPMVPFYEVSLGLNRETRDSDNDGLEDKGEITAGIFRGTDLFLADTDGDGLKDGSDPHPLDPDLPAEVPSP